MTEHNQSNDNIPPNRRPGVPKPTPSQVRRPQSGVNPGVRAPQTQNSPGITPSPQGASQNPPGSEFRESTQISASTNIENQSINQDPINEGQSKVQGKPLRPDAEEGALAWAYLAVVAVIFLGLIFTAWACQDNEEAGGLKNDPNADVNSTQVSSADSSQNTQVQTTVAYNPEQLASKQEEVNKLLLDNKIVFNANESSIKSGESVLTEVANSVKDLPINLKVEGYTDSVGDENDNLKLSQDRAATVKDKLIAQGIDASRISTEGFGETKAVQDNPSDEQKEADRRIEIKLSNQ